MIEIIFFANFSENFSSFNISIFLNSKNIMILGKKIGLKNTLLKILLKNDKITTKNVFKIKKSNQ